MSLPRLYVVAGPNGAGKSIYASVLTGLNNVFNGDVLFRDLMKEYPNLPDSAYKEMIESEYFPKAKRAAIDKRQNFAFETNFSTKHPTTSVREFRAAGYLTHLIFISVPFVEECHQRIKLRMGVGGHNVSAATVEYNFRAGHENLYRFFSEFDHVSLWSNAITVRPMIPILLLEWSKETLETSKLRHNLPDWANKFVDAADSHREIYRS